MTLSVASTPQQVTGTGLDTVINTVFLFFDATDIKVTQRIDSTGVDTVLVKDTHYSVAGGSSEGATGTVTVISGATNFTTLMTWTIERVVPRTQATDYTPSGDFPAVSHEAALDKLTMHVQELESKLDRALRFPVSDTTSLTSELDDSVARASKALTFDINGNATVSTQTTVGYELALLDSTTVTNAATATLTSTNWPATYDRVLVEIASVEPLQISPFAIKPLDGGSPLSSSLTGVGVVYSGSIVGHTRADWSTSVVTADKVGIADTDVLTGVAEFSYTSTSRMNGWLRVSYGNSGSKAMQIFLRTSVAAVTSWDGFQFSMSTGNITGTFRLWGIPKS